MYHLDTLSLRALATWLFHACSLSASYMNHGRELRSLDKHGSRPLSHALSAATWARKRPVVSRSAAHHFTVTRSCCTDIYSSRSKIKELVFFTKACSLLLLCSSYLVLLATLSSMLQKRLVWSFALLELSSAARYTVCSARAI